MERPKNDEAGRSHGRSGGERTETHQLLRWGGGELRFDGRDSWGHVLPIGGDEEGDAAKPSDLLPLSLGACTAYDVARVLRKQRQGLVGLEVRLTSEQDPDPPFTFLRIGMHFVLTGEVDERKADRAIELSLSKYCSVAASIRATVAIETSFEVVPG